MTTLLEMRKEQVNRLQREREILEYLLKRETGWTDEELAEHLRFELSKK